MILEPKKNDKLFYLNGISSVEPAFHITYNTYKHANNKTLFHSVYHFSGYPNFHDIPDEAGLFDEPYGYEHGDDPFDNTGKTAYVYLLLVFGFISLAHFMHAHLKFDNRKIGEVIYH